MRAPGSMTTSLISASRVTAAVRPAADDDFPDAYTALGRNVDVHFKNCDFPVAGSPTMPMLISPRSLTPSCVVFGMTPTNIHKIPFLISVHPFTDGAIPF